MGSDNRYIVFYKGDLKLKNNNFTNEKKVPLVSIGCITYNHEDYIAKAIESFLMQKTSFEFEIIIHDDASTDRTPEIIEEYAKKYPNIIRTIYQRENQYSKGICVGKFPMEEARGKYYAICEGDDFWTSPYKLEKQISYMEEHPDCSLCVHPSFKVHENGKLMRNTFRPFSNNRTVSIEEILKKWLFPTNSIICKRELLGELPNFYYDYPSRDFSLVVYLALKGKVYYIDEIMSAYRVFSKNSITSRVFKERNLEKRKIFENVFVKLLNDINNYTGHKYSKVIEEAILYREFIMLISIGEVRIAKSEKYKKFYDKLSIRQKVSLYIMKYAPRLFFIIKLTINNFTKNYSFKYRKYHG